MKKVTLIIVMFILIGITLNIYAQETSTFNIEVQNSNNNISKEQKQVTIDLYLKNYEGDGTLGYEGKLEYDTKIFKSATITALNNWDKVVYDSATGKFVSTTIDAKAETKIAQITLELKENVTAETTQIKVVNLVTSDGIAENTINKTITYNFPHNVKPEEPKNEEENKNTNTETQEDGTLNKTEKEPPKQLTVEAVDRDAIDDTKAKTQIPQTGTTALGATITLIVIALGIIGYIKYRSIELK